MEWRFRARSLNLAWVGCNLRLSVDQTMANIMYNTKHHDQHQEESDNWDHLYNMSGSPAPQSNSQRSQRFRSSSEAATIFPAAYRAEVLTFSCERLWPQGMVWNPICGSSLRMKIGHGRDLPPQGPRGCWSVCFVSVSCSEATCKWESADVDTHRAVRGGYQHGEFDELFLVHPDLTVCMPPCQ